MLESLSLNTTQSLEAQLNELRPIVASVIQEPAITGKLAVLNRLASVKRFFSSRPCFKKVLQGLSPLEEYLVKTLVVIQQIERCVPYPDEQIAEHKKALIELVSELKEIEAFYDTLGGVLGYHMASIRLLSEIDSPQSAQTEECYFPPFGVDLTQDTLYLRERIVEGIAAQGEMAEIYPVGGSADRLNLHDERTHIDLPAARLEFLGYTLLEWIIRDLQAREYMHFKIFHKQVTTPIALMTSHEKNNDRLVRDIFQEHRFFGRTKESVTFFSQPLVPTFTREGNWCLQRPMKLLLKPGGHGVIWKLAAEKKVLEWFAVHGRSKAIIRQINNPIAGVDLGLLAFTGVGCMEGKSFGFASCVRRVKTSEGMNILKQTKTPEGVRIVLSNIEYCDFKKFGIEDTPTNVNEPYSVFPSNTNILFVDLTEIAKVLQTLTYPGMLVNFKETQYYDPEKGYVYEEVARLELLMQNIADGFVETFSQPLQKEPYPNLKTFITFNERHKTISPTKKQFVPGSGLVETALGCFYDYLRNAQELLEHSCHIEVPPLVQEEEFLEHGPSFIFLYHPALGPLYSVIGQKIRGGSLALYAELQLEIADVDIENLHVQGSLLVQALQVMGHEVDETLCYSYRTGRCRLKNVTIKNRGIDRTQKNIYWKNSIQRHEMCCVILEGFSEFIAENVILSGDHTIVVKDGERVRAVQMGDQVAFHRESMEMPSHEWRYHITPDYHIRLTSTPVQEKSGE